jgi:MFS superfamily sulfate permease-like transporter
MLFIKFLLFLFFVVVVTVVIGIAVAFIRLRRMAEKLTGKDSSRTKPTAHDDFVNNSNSQTSGRKIIPKDEGEYIDFEEVKE